MSARLEQRARVASVAERVRRSLVEGDASVDRRGFLGVVAARATALAAGGLATLGACNRSPTPTAPEGDDAMLPVPASVTAVGLSLTAAPGTAALGGGRSVSAWLFNGLMPSPPIRARRGENARISLLNHLPEETIVHWHGLIVPEEADGHPRQAIPPVRGSVHRASASRRAWSWTSSTSK